MYTKESAREFQRRRAVELSEQGKSASLISRMLGVSAASVYKWRRIHRAGGSLKFVAPSGRPRRLSNDQLESLRKLLSLGATAHGWHNDLWTSKRVAEDIRRHFNIKFSRCHVWLILRQYMGWTVKRPIKQLRERNEARIERWKSENLPQILEDAQQKKAYLVFVDESGFMLSPTIRRTFAPRGQSPVIKVMDPHSRISAIGAITVSPVRKHLNAHYRLLPDNANFHSDSVVQFMSTLRRRISGPIILLWDEIPIHCSRLIRQYLKHDGHLIVEPFPPYAPELNPVDKVWLYLKFDRLPNFAPATLDELRTRLNDELQTLRRKQDVLDWCLRRTGLSFKTDTHR